MKYYVVDAFTGPGFRGNPAGVCIVNAWPSDARMQEIAAENNLAETVFVWGRAGRYTLRWFTPVAEVDLCGHATLAAAYSIAHFVEPGVKRIQFQSCSGALTVECTGNHVVMDFPVRMPMPVPAPVQLDEILAAVPVEVLLSRDLFVVLESEDAVRSVNPDFEKMKALKQGEGIIVTAPGEKYDFVSRCFYPKLGIPEDPVTGSAHCNLIPYWAKRLGRTSLTGAQLSKRGGLLSCSLCKTRVRIGGAASLYLTGEIVDGETKTIGQM